MITGRACSLILFPPGGGGAKGKPPQKSKWPPCVIYQTICPPWIFFSYCFYSTQYDWMGLTFLVNHHDRHIRLILDMSNYSYLFFCILHFVRENGFLGQNSNLIADNPRFIITIQTLNWKEISIFMFILHVAREKMFFSINISSFITNNSGFLIIISSFSLASVIFGIDNKIFGWL